jgi:hypothetical protein
MEQEKLEDILADVKQEGADPFANMDETPSESLPENEPVVEEKALPFHEDPKVQAYLDRQMENREARIREEFESRIENLQEISTPTSSSIPAWFSELYGDNEIAWQKYSEHEQARTEEIENRILARQQEEAQRQIKETEHWNNWVDTEINRLAASGHKFDRNKLIKTMLDYSPTDENNNLDFDKGMRIYEALEEKPDSTKSVARKALADTTTVTSTTGESPKKDYMSSNELRRRSMSSL